MKDGKNRAPKKGKTDEEQNIEIELWKVKISGNRKNTKDRKKDLNEGRKEKANGCKDRRKEEQKQKRNMEIQEKKTRSKEK